MDGHPRCVFQHFMVYCQVSMINVYQQYQVRKRPLPPSDDEEQKTELAAKLMNMFLFLLMLVQFKTPLIHSECHLNFTL